LIFDLGFQLLHETAYHPHSQAFDVGLKRGKFRRQAFSAIGDFKEFGRRYYAP
jgi:hypothetical protein